MNWLQGMSLAALVVILSAGVVACGGTSEEIRVSRCTNVECPGEETCDELDGACKCGGAGGVVCREGQECSLDPTPTCSSPMCQFTHCERGESCDSLTGECGCGGDRCDEGESCVDEVCQPVASCLDLSCPDGMSCDPADGACKCAGERCEEGEVCIDGACAVDRCSGVNCSGNSSCDPRDGACHCGGAGGPICRVGEACTKIGEAFDCAVSDRCADVECVGGTVCDPTDGKCRCGGVGAMAPACSPEQTCVEGQCRGGGLCPGLGEPNRCAAGTSCDPADGICKCGGAGGPVCGAGEACTRIEGSYVCARTCNILGNPTGCGPGQGCYYEGGFQRDDAFCAPAGNVPLNQHCLHSLECQPGHYCSPSASECRRICKPSEGAVGCTGVGGGTVACAQIPGGPADVGYCISAG